MCDILQEYVVYTALHTFYKAWQLALGLGMVLNQSGEEYRKGAQVIIKYLSHQGVEGSINSYRVKSTLQRHNIKVCFLTSKLFMVLK